MNDSPNKWMILAHCFNMDGRAASQTITDKIPYLISKGVVPIVISAPTGIKDKTFPHYQILSPAPSGLNFELRKMIEKRYGNGNRSKILKSIVTICCFPFYLIEKLFINLDSHWSWFMTAGLKGSCLIRSEKPQVIYSTAGPSSTHLAAYILKRKFKIPWIAEVHDPLISDTGKRRYQRYAFHKWLEHAIFQHADAVIFFTETALKNARRRTCISGNSHVLRPGANPPIGSGVKYKKTDIIRFGHFGSLASDRNLRALMEAFASFLEKRPELRGRVKLDVYGTTLDSVSKHAVERFGLSDVVCEWGRIEYDPVTGKSGRQQVFEKMHQCDVLVLLHGHSNISDEYIPSKLYEYLLTGRPIAGITSKESELGLMLLNAGHSVIDPDESGAIESALDVLVHKWQKNGIGPVENTSYYTVENTVNQLIRITKACLAKSVSSS